MSKRFKQQDYTQYPKIGKKGWRKPRGLQSKLRIRKGGSGILPKIGYRTEKGKRDKINGKSVVVVRNIGDINRIRDESILLSSSIGSKKTLQIAEAAKKSGLKIINMKKVKKAEKIISFLYPPTNKPAVC